MSFKIRTVVALVASWTLLAPLSGAQSDFKDWLDSLEKAVKEKKDEQAVRAIQTLLARFDTLEKDEQKKAAKALEKCLSRRRGEDDHGVHDIQPASRFDGSNREENDPGWDPQKRECTDSLNGRQRGSGFSRRERSEQAAERHSPDPGR